MEGLQKLPDIVLKYLKYMAFVKSASPHTLRAYALDLCQAYNLNKSDFFSLTRENFSTKNRVSHESVQPFDPKQIFDQTQLALHKWAKLSLSSRNRKIATLKSFFGWMYSESLIEKDFSHQLHSPKVPRKLPHFLSVDEVIACLKSFIVEPHQQQVEADDLQARQEEVLFLLLYGGGLRISEACTLKWKNISLSERKILVRGKGGKERLISAPRMTFEKLKALKTKSNGEFVFGKAELGTRKGFEWIRCRGVKAQLLKPLNPHALRHSFATHMLSGGSNLRVLQEILGHESLHATEKYTHLDVHHLARTMEATHPLEKKRKQAKFV